MGKMRAGGKLGEGKSVQGGKTVAGKMQEGF